MPTPDVDAIHEVPSSYTGIIVLMLSRPGPVMVLLIALSCMAAKSVIGWHVLDIVVISALWLCRGLLEWVLHRHVWHWRGLPYSWAGFSRYIPREHARHHEFPDDAEKLFMGWPGISAASLLCLALSLMVSASLSMALTITFAFMLILFSYEFCHAIAHSGIYPVTPIFRAGVMCHRAHHYIDGNTCMGVSSALGDRLFGTYIEYENHS